TKGRALADEGDVAADGTHIRVGEIRDKGTNRSRLQERVRVRKDHNLACYRPDSAIDRRDLSATGGQFEEPNSRREPAHDVVRAINRPVGGDQDVEPVGW